MKLPLDISFQGVDRSDAVEDAVTRHAGKLDDLYPDIMRCRVSLILDEKHKSQGKQFNVRIDLTIPGRELVSNNERDKDIYVALRDAFKDITRMLEDTVRKQRDESRQQS